MNYNDVVKKLREMARDVLRLKRTNKLRSDLLASQNQVDMEKKVQADYLALQNKRIAQAQYDLTKLDPANPSFADKQKGLNDAITEYQKAIQESGDNSVKLLTTLQKPIDELNKKIAETQDGTWKCDMCALQTETDVLVQKVMENAALSVSLADEPPAAS